MNQAGPQNGAGALNAQSFAARPPSQAWEAIPLDAASQHVLWVWYKPAPAPNGIILRLPYDAAGNLPQETGTWTIRRLLVTAGIDPASVLTWTLYGTSYPAMGGTNPLFDAAIPPAPVGTDPSVTVAIGPPAAAALLPAVPPYPAVAGIPMAAAPALMPAMPVMSASPSMAKPTATAAAGSGDALTNEIFDRIVIEWSTAQELDRNIGRLRKQLVDLMARLSALDRDLTPPERLHGTNEDKREWTDCRRRLRDANLRLTRYIKECDIGDVSNAGQKKWLEETYHNFVVPRIPFEGLQQAERSFELYRKMMQTLQAAMNSAYSIASNDAERKSQQVMGRIQTKVREATARKNFFGVMFDGH